MPAWIALTLMAAFVQTLRFALQKRLRNAGVGPLGATLARFLFSAPLVALGLFAYARASDQPLPLPGGRFWAFALSGGLAQIVATVAVVALFAHRNFAVGITFKKTEVIQTALVSVVILGEGVGRLGWLALAIGLIAVVILSDPPASTEPGLRRFLNRAAGLGLFSGAAFAVSAVGYRGASLSLPSGDFALRAGTTLALVTASQTVAMLIFMSWRHRDEIRRVLLAWRPSLMVGLTSMVGSFGWFAAYALQNAALVGAVGQIELLFSILVSRLMFGESLRPREALGIAGLAVSIVLVILSL